MIEQYTTIDGFRESRFKEKGSLFISQAYPVTTDEEALAILKDIKKKFYDATHHCSGWRLLNNFKYSDDGEPNGTAGIRILNAIDHFNLTNVMVVVIRYFGGVKLGVGPLGKAYYYGTELVLQDTVKIEKLYYEELTIAFAYDFVSSIHQMLEKSEAKITNSEFDTGVKMTFLLRPKYLEQLEAKIIPLTKGSAVIAKTGKVVYL